MRREDPEGEFVRARSRSRAQYVSLCYPRISRHSHLSFLRPYTNIYRSPFLYARKTRGPCCADLSREARLLARAFVYEGIKARRDATSRVETGNDHRSPIVRMDAGFDLRISRDRNFVNPDERAKHKFIREYPLSNRGINNISALTRLDSKVFKAREILSYDERLI